MKQIIATFAAIILATGLALAGSAATAGSTVIHSKNGVIYYSSSDHGGRQVSRSSNREHGLHRSQRSSNRFVRQSRRNGFYRGQRQRSHGFNRAYSFKKFKKHGGFRRH